MNINRIETISTILFETTKRPLKLVENKDYVEIKKVELKDNNMNRNKEHDPLYYYDLMKNQYHPNIKDGKKK